MPRRRSILTDAQWAKMEPHLPRMRRSAQGGRPRISHRAVVEGILWVLKTGARWRDLPKGYPSGVNLLATAPAMGREGAWLELWRGFLGELDARGLIRWENTFLDGSSRRQKGGSVSGKPSGEKARSGWWWSTAGVFLWEFMSPRPTSRRSPSRRPR